MGNLPDSTQALVRDSKKKPGTLPFIVFDSLSKRETVPILNLRKNAYEILRAKKSKR